MRRTCGCFGCTEPAAASIRHPEHGQRVVCPEHAEDYPVIKEVA